MSSIVLRNASVLDGTGTAPSRADVLVNASATRLAGLGPILLKNSMFGRARLRVLEDRVVG